MRRGAYEAWHERAAPAWERNWSERNCGGSERGEHGSMPSSSMPLRRTPWQLLQGLRNAIVASPLLVLPFAFLRCQISTFTWLVPSAEPQPSPLLASKRRDCTYACVDPRARCIAVVRSQHRTALAISDEAVCSRRLQPSRISMALWPARALLLLALHGADGGGGGCAAEQPALRAPRRRRHRDAHPRRRLVRRAPLLPLQSERLL
eukprot:3906540-Pleurochrysis_carterae.AAC.1